jgi:hypothetical protein
MSVVMEVGGSRSEASLGKKCENLFEKITESKNDLGA